MKTFTNEPSSQPSGHGPDKQEEKERKRKQEKSKKKDKDKEKENKKKNLDDNEVGDEGGLASASEILDTLPIDRATSAFLQPPVSPVSRRLSRKFNAHVCSFDSTNSFHDERANLLKFGYVLLSKQDWLPSTDHESLVHFTSSTPTLKMSSILNQKERLQIQFPPLENKNANITRIHNRLLDILREVVRFDEAWTTHLRSLKGARRQEMHLDFPPTGEEMRAAYLAGNGSCSHFAMYAIDEFELEIAEGSHHAVHRLLSGQKLEETSPVITIKVLPGQLLIVRGDVVHAGGAFPRRCKFAFIDRLHFYLDVNGIGRDEKKTFLDPKLVQSILNFNRSSSSSSSKGRRIRGGGGDGGGGKDEGVHTLRKRRRLNESM